VAVTVYAFQHAGHVLTPLATPRGTLQWSNTD
jgi:hypothetical protein